MTSDGFFELEELPRRAVVVGAGYIAVELAGILQALGTERGFSVLDHDRFNVRPRHRICKRDTITNK